MVKIIIIFKVITIITITNLLELTLKLGLLSMEFNGWSWV